MFILQILSSRLWFSPLVPFRKKSTGILYISESSTNSQWAAMPAQKPPTV